MQEVVPFENRMSLNLFSSSLAIRHNLNELLGVVFKGVSAYF